MQKTCVVLVWALITASDACVLASDTEPARETPISVVIVKEALHSREGIGKTNAVSVRDRATIAKLEAFFANYEKRPSSEFAAGWIAGHRVYFNFQRGRTICVTVSKNGGGATWSVGNGDFETNGDFAAFLSELQRRATR